MCPPHLFISTYVLIARCYLGIHTCRGQLHNRRCARLHWLPPWSYSTEFPGCVPCQGCLCLYCSCFVAVAVGDRLSPCPAHHSHAVVWPVVSNDVAESMERLASEWIDHDNYNALCDILPKRRRHSSLHGRNRGLCLDLLRPNCNPLEATPSETAVMLDDCRRPWCHHPRRHESSRPPIHSVAACFFAR